MRAPCTLPSLLALSYLTLSACSSAGGANTAAGESQAEAADGTVPAQVAPEPQPATDVQPKNTVKPNQDDVARAEAATDIEHHWFETGITIDAGAYGLVGDGKTDNTQRLRELLASGNRTIYVPAGDYLTDRLRILANTRLILAPGTTIRDAGKLRKWDSVLTILHDNVHIVGYGARVIADRADYTSGEYRHGVYVFGATNVFIEGLESSHHGGDGFFIGGPLDNDDPATDVTLKGVAASDNRRQGLSIIAGRHVRIIDSEFADTNGTAPQFGVDVEADVPGHVLDDIIFLRPRTQGNRGGGIMIYLGFLDSSSAPVDITIIDHTSSQESPMLLTNVPRDVRATIRYGRSDPP